MAVMCNCLTAYLALRVDPASATRAPTILQLNKLIDQCLERARLCVRRSPGCLTGSREQSSLEDQVKGVVDAIKDPVVRFRCLHILGHIVSLCCVVCVYVRQYASDHKVDALVKVLQELTSMLCSEELQQVIPYWNGRFLAACGENEHQQHYPTVGDFTRLILLASSSVGDSEHVPVSYTHWHWLGQLLHCKQLLKKGKHFAAMESLELLLASDLDPEVRSACLCLFSECYLQQDCPQLCLQTYKQALRVYEGNHAVLLRLSDVYGTLEQPDLELECLNLLVRLLMDKHLRGVTPIVDIHFDALVFSTWQVLPQPRLSAVLHQFARRCFQLGRYSEAAEQYVSLLKLLEEASHTAENGPVARGHQLDIQVVVVEAAESLALAHQADECLSLVDQFFPILSHPSFGGACETDDSLMLESSDVLGDSQACLFPSLPNSMDDQSKSRLNKNLQSQARAESMDASVEGASLGNVSLSTPLPGLCKTARRKRQRSQPFARGGEECAGAAEETTKGQQRHDKWWAASLAVRLLQSKADALTLTSGYSEDVMDCLQRAHDLLLTDQPSIFTNFSDTATTTTKPAVSQSDSPQPKRRRKLAEQQGVSQGPYQVSELWSSTMVKVSQKLIQAAMSCGQFLTVRNVALLLLQLDPENFIGKSSLEQLKVTTGRGSRIVSVDVL